MARIALPLTVLAVAALGACATYDDSASAGASMGIYRVAVRMDGRVVRS